MTGDSDRIGLGRLYLRQLLAGRDFATRDEFAADMANYVYAIGDREHGEAVLVDPAYAPSELIEVLGADGLKVVGAIVTHYHADHAGGRIAGHPIAGLAALLQGLDVPIHANRAEVSWLVDHAGVDVAALVAHESGDKIAVGGIDISLIHTPGHTEGSQCLLVSENLLTGDTLFLDGCGRTDLPGGDPAELYESLNHRLAPIADSVPVFPGHAYSRMPSEPMGEVRRHNPVLAHLDRERWLSRFGG